MVARQDTIFERFLAPVFRLLIDETALREFHDQTDWRQVRDRFEDPDLIYPAYYENQNFHGIKDGYLNPEAATTYDPITQYVIWPNERMIRQAAVDRIQGTPRRILDLGCGTGSTTVLLKQAFPQAEVTGLDLSPYMLFMADRKARQKQLNLRLIHGNAQRTSFKEGAFDLVTASLLFHETPPSVADTILTEAFRLLVPGGQIIILDANQPSLQQAPWLMHLFEEPYIQAYAVGSMDAWMTTVGFQWVQTEDQWWSNQISWGLKPMLNQQPHHPSTWTSEIFGREWPGQTAPAFSLSP